MTDLNPEVPVGGGPVEAKTWAASWASFLAAGAGLTILGSFDTDFIKALPDVLEVPVYSLVVSATTFLAAYLKGHKPGKLSWSGVKAARRVL